MKVLDTLFRRLEDTNLTLALSKCQFGVNRLEYLGYVIDSNGLTPIKKKVAALQNFPGQVIIQICISTYSGKVQHLKLGDHVYEARNADMLRNVDIA